MMSAVKITNLKKIYSDGTEALKGITFNVPEGDFCALLGANGAGKTTIIGIMTDLINKTSGDVIIFGHNIETHFADAKYDIGVVPQEMNFNMFEKVEDIITTQAGYFGIERKVALKECEMLLKELQLWEKRRQVARNLSGGMKRRLMIARALINKPKLLILDEPTAGVDVELRHSMWDYLLKLNRQGTTILLTTHYLEEVEQLCRNAAIIKNGEIIAYDKVRNLIDKMDSQVFVAQVKTINGLQELRKTYTINEVDDVTLEITLTKGQDLNELMDALSHSQMRLTDFRPKGNRMEHLYLDILKNGDNS